MSSWVAAAPHIAVLIITTLKVWQIIRSDIWIWKHGVEYQREYGRLSNAALRDSDVRDALLDRMGAGIFPFGVKSYRLRRWLRQRKKGFATWVVILPVKIFYVLFAFYVYPIVASVYTAGVAYLPDRGGGINPSIYLAFTSGCLVLIGCLGIAVEAALSYSQMSAWGTIYHGFGRGRSDNPARSQSEFSVAIGAILMAFISGIGVTYLAGARLGAFAKIPDAGVGDLLSASVYYALTETLQAGDADPRNNFGRLIVALVAVNSAAFFFIVVALVIGSTSGSPTEPRLTSSMVNEPGTKVCNRRKSPSLGRISTLLPASALALSVFIWCLHKVFCRHGRGPLGKD